MTSAEKPCSAISWSRSPQSVARYLRTPSAPAINRSTKLSTTIVTSARSTGSSRIGPPPVMAHSPYSGNTSERWRRRPSIAQQILRGAYAVALFRSNGAPGYRAYALGYYSAFLLDPDGNDVEALYRDVGNIGHDATATLH